MHHTSFSAKSSTAETDDVLPWQDKYRPATLKQVVGQDETLSVLKTFMIHRKFPHLLFHGPPGTGKTSTILALARQLYGDAGMSQMVLELNASDDRSVHNVQTRIKAFASTRPIFKVPLRESPYNMFKLVILDEADTMDHTAQMALRRIIEDYAAFTRFCIITNNIHRLLPALISRCARLRFPPLRPSAIRTLLLQVATTENIQVRPEALEYLSTTSHGDMRQALAVLQECHLNKTSQQASTSNLPAQGVITVETIREYTHTPLSSDISVIIEGAKGDNYNRCIISINQIKSETGLILADLLTAVSARLQHAQAQKKFRVRHW
ncbi:Subunit of heteropentameric Replication factor C (RF-C), variant 2 [Aspergillus fumigatus]